MGLKCYLLCIWGLPCPLKVLSQNLLSSAVSICSGSASATAWPRLIKDMLTRLCVLSSMCLRQRPFCTNHGLSCIGLLNLSQLLYSTSENCLEWLVQLRVPHTSDPRALGWAPPWAHHTGGINATLAISLETERLT